MRVAFFGTPQPAVPALEALVAAPDIDVACVVTNPDRPAGRGQQPAPPPVKAIAEWAGLVVWQPERPREVIRGLDALELDAAAVVAYGALLPADVLGTARHGFVNLHFSLLPAWRGAAPVTHSILHGDAETGVTCFLLDEGMDTGPVLVAEPTAVGEQETAGELTTRLAELGAPLLVDALHGLVAGRLTPTPQEHDNASYAPKIAPEDAELDWTRPAVELSRAVRAFNPVPGAYTELGGARLKIHRARVLDSEAETGDEPGTVVGTDERAPVVACGRGTLRLDEVQPAGKARMPGSAFANGYRPVGDRLGADA